MSLVFPDSFHEIFPSGVLRPSDCCPCKNGVCNMIYCLETFSFLFFLKLSLILPNTKGGVRGGFLVL